MLYFWLFILTFWGSRWAEDLMNFTAQITFLQWFYYTRLYRALCSPFACTCQTPLSVMEHNHTHTSIYFQPNHLGVVGNHFAFQAYRQPGSTVIGCLSNTLRWSMVIHTEIELICLFLEHHLPGRPDGKLLDYHGASCRCIGHSGTKIRTPVIARL